MKKFLKSLLGDTHPLRLLYHKLRSEYAAWKSGYPAKSLKVIAVTGTDGKTTTIAMIAHILHACGKTYGSASTAFFEVNGKREPNPTQKTSVSAAKLQSFLRRLVNEKCEFAVIEASSHGLMQGRLAGIVPTVAAVTNVTMEHLDYHGTMEAYTQAKGLLFASLRGGGTKVLNADDQSFALFRNIPSRNTFAYSPQHSIRLIRAGASSSEADVSMLGKTQPVTLGIPGTFNLHNALCAMMCALAAGIEPTRSAAALTTFTGTPGRMERVDAGQSFPVFIDFTVTPVAYKTTIASAKQLLGPDGRLLILTGSCGDRMREKRPMVGKICGEEADVVVVTNEDPYTEDPEAIIDDVLSGIPSFLPIFRSAANIPPSMPDRFCVRISDRLEAMRFLLRQAAPGDVVLLCGKGADVTMMTKYGQIPWVEREIAISELKALARG